ncbi:acyltransferase [Vibrio sp. T187]|uniref:acyltransferase n=1 Tax=Vibrio TaxID=662 RepID=UPI0010C94406|nr:MULTISPECIES: acyltransferase [Vibrio]MBW3697802.1 acyltransferase [Vibrio sp. T187]
MNTMSIHNFKFWLKSHPNSQIRNVFFILKKIRCAELRTPILYNKCLYFIHNFVTGVISSLTRILYFTPAFKGRLANCGKRLYLYGGIPFVSGPVTINLGDDCRVSGQTTFSGCSMIPNPSLIVGSNVDIGWQTTIAVGTKVVIEDNVRIAGGGFLFGYSGHPLDAKRRAQGEGDDPCQIGEIVLERDVWLGTNVTVKGGVTIGEASVIAAGSVVTKSIPPFSIVAGNPAKVVGQIPQADSTYESIGGSDA